MGRGQQVYKIRGRLERKKSTFLSPSLDWCMPAPSTIASEEEESVVDSGASMHMLSKEDLNSAGLDTVRV